MDFLFEVIFLQLESNRFLHFLKQIKLILFIKAKQRKRKINKIRKLFKGKSKKPQNSSQN